MHLRLYLHTPPRYFWNFNVASEKWATRKFTEMIEWIIYSTCKVRSFRYKMRWIGNDFWTPVGSRKSRKGIIKQVLSIHRYSRTSVFFEIESLVFSKFLHSVRNPYEIVHNKVGFYEKKAPKFAKICRNRVFLVYWKNLLLIFSEFVLEWKFSLFAIFLHKSHIWERYGSWDMGQNTLGQKLFDLKIFKFTQELNDNEK